MTKQVIETKICPISGQSFTITQSDLDFYNKISPSFGGKKFQIPTPTLAPIERQRRRLAFRNERNLYRRTCDASGKQIICMYSPNKEFKVYDQKVRWSDSRDAMSYGREFDYNTSFTEQFGKLMKDVPHMSLSVDNCEGSDYTNFVLNSKNCYLVYGGGNNEQVLYSNFVNGSSNSSDLSYCSDCEYCYECINCQGCYSCKYSINCSNSNNLIGCSDCESCNNCLYCTGLTNASYCIQNKQATKEQYQHYVSQQKLWTGLYQKSQDQHVLLSENCTGSNIVNCNNCQHCNDINNGEELQYCSFIPNGKNCYDLDFMAPFGSERGYELCTSTGTKFSFSTYLCRLCTSVYYCYECRSCEHCFGCVGLKDKSYCIFNKQYTKEEYEKTVTQIIQKMQETGEWGEFFHPSLSPFGYNETVAQEYYPLSSPSFPLPTGGGMTTRPIFGSRSSPSSGTDESRRGQRGWGEVNRSDYESPKPVSDKVLQGKDLPAGIDEVQDDILSYAISCEVTSKLFRIQPQELAFYRKHQISLPRKHPDQRHLERITLRK